MKVLQICPKPPFPTVDGGTIAMNVITQGLIDAGIDVKVLSISTHKHPFDSDKLPEEYKDKTNAEAIFIDTSIKINQVLFHLFSKDSYNIMRFVSKEFESKLIILLKNNVFQIIQLEGLFVTPYVNTIRKYSNAKIILRAHNIEYIIWERIAKTTSNPIKARYIKHLSKRLKTYEINLLKSYNGIVAISPEDEKALLKLGAKCPITTIPVGIDIPKKSIIQAEFPSLFYIGSMDWMPNVEGMNWFLKNVWSVINKIYPELKFYIAGRKSRQMFADEKHPNVEIIGEVENAHDFMASKSIMVVPLLSGSGIRVKIIEGMAMSKTIITSTIGAEGINCEHLHNILIADNANDFSEMIIKCIEDKSMCDKIGVNANKLAEEQFNNDLLTQKLIKFYHELI